MHTVCLECGMLATYESSTARSMLSVEALLRVEEYAVATAAGLALRTGAPASVNEMPEDDEQVGARNEKIMAKLMEYGRVTQLPSMRALMANIFWKRIQARLAWRETPARAPGDQTNEGRGTYTMERIVKYAQDGYVPFWMQKGAVDPWAPEENRWDTLSRNQVKDTPETEWFIWIAGIVDDIENDGRVLDFKAEGAKPNPYRDSIVDRVRLQAFKSKNPTRSDAFEKHGAGCAHAR